MTSKWDRVSKLQYLGPTLLRNKKLFNCQRCHVSPLGYPTPVQQSIGYKTHTQTNGTYTPELKWGNAVFLPALSI